MSEVFDDNANEFELEVERYELREGRPTGLAANRREFTQLLGAGLVFTLSTSKVNAQRRGARRDESLSERFLIETDGAVTVFSSKVDVGQGSQTQIAQAVGEELKLPTERIRVVLADTQRCPDDGGTAGSRTTPSTVPRVRAAAATLRDYLRAEAARVLDVGEGQISMVDGVFQTDRQSVSISELIRNAAIENGLSSTKVSAEASVAPPEQWTVLGTSPTKVNGRDVVTGATVFPSDVRRPNMLYGKVLRPPSYDSKLQSIDLAAVDSFTKVQTVRDGDFVGCVAPTSWDADKAIRELGKVCKWESETPSPHSDVFHHLEATAELDARQRGSDRWGEGLGWNDGRRELTGRFPAVASTYKIAYVQHAPMEPRTAVAEWSGNELTVWTGSQQPARVRQELSRRFRVPRESVRVIVPSTGGGFGGKHTAEAATEAAQLAKAVGQPVSLRWTRNEEFTWAYFRPAGLIHVDATLDSAGNIQTWDFTNYNSGRSAIATPYRVPHGRIRFFPSKSPLRQGSYRALASTANTFARESAMDELAASSKADPLEFRLRHLDDGRLKDVLIAAAKKFRWSERSKELVPGFGIGLACGTEKGSYVAACAAIDATGQAPRVVEICQVYECGAIHHPVNLRAQHAGAVIMGLGPALFEQIKIRDGGIANPQFSSYRVPRMRDMPQLDLSELNRSDLPSVGAGETPIIAVAPAIANAMQRATGKRSREMPQRWT